MPDFVPRCLCNFDQKQPMLISYRSGRCPDWLDAGSSYRAVLIVGCALTSGRRAGLWQRVLGSAFEMVCALRAGDCDEGVKQAIATKLIALAKTGERNPRYFVRRAIEKHSHAPIVGRFGSCEVFGSNRPHLRTVKRGLPASVGPLPLTAPF
jgi:hypothetical protein